jgi:DNA-binding SARP family transcriptional activator
VQLRLLGHFTVVVDGSPLAVSPTGQRLLARVALNEDAEERGVLAGALWPRKSESRAQANLRGVMWRLPDAVRRRLALGAGTVAFDDCWDVDVHAAERLAASAGRDPCSDALPPVSLFRYDLLPDWNDSWLLVHRERYRQLRLHALEDLAHAHLIAGRPLHATDCALLAIAAEPLRESAQRLLLRGHLAAGNRAAAWASYQQFRKLLVDELGVQPSSELTALVSDLDAARRIAPDPPSSRRV